MSTAATTSPDHADINPPVAETLAVNAPVSKTEVSVVSPEINGLEEKINEQVHKVVDATMRSFREEAAKSDARVIEFAATTSRGIAELQKGMEAIATDLKVVQEKQEKKSIAETQIQAEKPEKRETPSGWQRFKEGVRSFWRGVKKGGEKVGQGAEAVGGTVADGARWVGHQGAEAVRGVDDILRDTTKLVVGKGAGNVMKYGSYLALGAPAWMPKVWNFLMGKDGNGKKIEKKSFGRKLAIAAGWAGVGLPLLGTTWQGWLLYYAVATGAWGMSALGKKFVEEAKKPDGFKITSRVAGGVGAVGAYGAVGGGSTFALGALSAGLLGRVYRWVKGGGSPRKEKQSSPKPLKLEESVPESEVAAPPDVKKILDEMEAARKEQEKVKDHAEKHGKENHMPDDHSHPEQKPEQKEPQPASSPAHDTVNEAVQGGRGEGAHAKEATKPETPGAH